MRPNSAIRERRHFAPAQPARGQSGGPVFDTQGRIWGVQSLTKHLDLDFDINQTVLRAGKPKHVSESAFLHAGECIDVNVIKDFMRSNNVHFTEA